MVVRVRQAMIVPSSIQGGENGCKVANHLQSSRDLCLQPAAMEKKSKGGVENGKQGGHEAMMPWQRATSESSMSSIDSVLAAESPFSPPDMQATVFRKPRVTMHAFESDDESFPEATQEDYLNNKSKRPFVGGTVQPHPAASLNVDEGDPEAGPVTNRGFPVHFEEEKHFRVRISPMWLASARKLSSGLDDYNESFGSEDAFLPRGCALSNLEDNCSSCKTLSDSESLPNFRYQFESHPGSCSVGMGSVVPDHGSTPSDDGKDPSSRVKFMCSFGGKIFPRPLDSKLRYVGGDTKIIAINRDTTFNELIAKMREVYPQALTLKYQLPNEDLDALVSVSTDEDLQNMVEEYDKLERADGSSRLRVFLFPTVDYDASSHRKDSSGDLRNSEQRYVDAVNGISEVGSRNRIEIYGGGTLPFVSDNLIGLDGPDPWNSSRGGETVPVAMLAGLDVPAHIHCVPVAVPVSNITSRPNAAASAPSSAPSSPPLLPRQAGKLPVIADLHLQYHPDTHSKISAQYNVLVGEGSYQDNESYGGSGASSSASQHESLYRSSDCRRGPESPPRKQHDGGYQDHPIRGEQRRLSETKMPRVSSHGKLTRLNEHSEGGVPSSTSEAQQLSEQHLSAAEFQRRIQQQQQLLHQPVWQHPLDPQQDNYRRSELLQPTVAQNAVLGQQQQGYQQQHSMIYRQGLPQGVGGLEGVQQYSDELLHQIPRSISSQAIAPPVVASGQSTSYYVGSAPSSPRLSYRDVPSRHAPVPAMHWAYTGNAFGEQPYSRRLNYVDKSARVYRVSNSPPKYREQLAHAEERLLRQQQTLANTEALHHEQVSKSGLLYETNAVTPQYDLLSGPQVPLYKGHNPFQESVIAYQDHQDIAEARRHQLSQQGKDSRFLSGQQHLHIHHQTQRLDYQDPVLQSVEQLSVHSRFQEPLHKVSDWDSEESRSGFRIRPRAGPLDDELLVDSSSSVQRDFQQANYPGLHLPETSDDLLSASVGDYPGVHIKADRLELSGNAGFQFRPGMLPPSALGGGFTGSKIRSNISDSSVGPRYSTRANEPDYMAPGGLRGVGNGQDLRSLFEVNGHHLGSSGVGPGLQLPSVSQRLMEDRANPGTFNPITQQMQNLRLGENSTMLNSDIRWNGGLGADDGRVDVPTMQVRDGMGNLFEDRLQGLPNLAVGTRVGRLSRPSSSTNIPSLIEEEMLESANLHTYETQCRSSSLLDEDSPRLNDSMHSYALPGVAAIENPLFTTNPLRYGNPPPLVDAPVPPVADMFLFDPTPAGSSSSEYHHLLAEEDLPNIKTIATQVPSIEGDESGGSTSSSSGASDHSRSDLVQGEHFLGQLTMTQHMAEDMASLVLDDSTVSVQASKEHSMDGGVVDSQAMWPLETSPTLSRNFWENALDEAALTEGADNGENYDAENDSVQEVLESLASTTKVSASEGAKVGPLAAEKETSTEISPDDAAAEAVAHGLQTIKNADLEELRELGSGTFGTVYHGKWRGTDVAIKRIKASCFAGRPSEQERLIADFWREACNLGNLHHPNVVAFYGVVSDGPGGTLATVTEYMVNGSLKQVLQKKDRTIDRRKRLLIAMDSAFGMEYLHGKNIVHFDLKCENLLVNMRDPHRPICKVGDLGLSKVKHQTMVSGGVRGTLPWMAPELLNGSSSLVTEKVDVFSFGIVMWELLTGEEPYANMHYGAIIGGIVNNSLRPPVPTWCDPAWRSLMERCWSADPSSRPSFTEIASELRAMADSLKPKSQPQTQGQHSPSTQIQL